LNAKEKKKFIKDLTNSIRDELVAKVKDMPECWDGIELRLLLAKKFESEVFPVQRKRLKDFNNTVATTTI
jgi:hypothetical protein